LATINGYEDKNFISSKLYTYTGLQVWCRNFSSELDANKPPQDDVTELGKFIRSVISFPNLT